jgi:starch synthase (maltosyl-transferring)
MSAPSTMLIYNLFPLLAGPFLGWAKHMERAAAMGFSWIFVNPIQRSGKSQSLYAVSDYDVLDPRMLDPHSALGPEEQLQTAMTAAGKLGLQMMTDLVANHCAVDSPLVKSHPEWFVWEGAGRVARPWCRENGKKVVWGDLALFDHRHTRDTEGLYRFFRGVVEGLCARGFRGFRCDAAYQLPTAFWRRLISETKAAHPETIFLAETLGCQLDQTLRTASAGFDYVFNSFKWWDFRGAWLTKQYAIVRDASRTVSFAESHDTPRLADELHGHIEACKQRYLVSALFSSAVMMPIGFEFAFRRRLHVVRTRPEDWEDTGVDLRSYIKRVNALKTAHAIFQEDSPVEIQSTGNDNILVLWKGSAHTREEVLLIVNRDLHGTHGFQCDNLSWFVQSGNPFTDLSPENPMRRVHTPFRYDLRPAQALVLQTNR